METYRDHLMYRNGFADGLQTALANLEVVTKYMQDGDEIVSQMKSLIASYDVDHKKTDVG